MRKIFSMGVLTLMMIFSSLDVSASTSPAHAMLDCGAPPSGKEWAVYGIQNEDSLAQPNTYNPDTVLCIPVDPGATGWRGSDLRNAIISPGNIALITRIERPSTNYQSFNKFLSDFSALRYYYCEIRGGSGWNYMKTPGSRPIGIPTAGSTLDSGTHEFDWVASTCAGGELSSKGYLLVANPHSTTASVRLNPFGLTTQNNQRILFYYGQSLTGLPPIDANWEVIPPIPSVEIGGSITVSVQSTVASPYLTPTLSCATCPTPPALASGQINIVIDTSQILNRIAFAEDGSPAKVQFTVNGVTGKPSDTGTYALTPYTFEVLVTQVNCAPLSATACDTSNACIFTGGKCRSALSADICSSITNETDCKETFACQFRPDTAGGANSGGKCLTKAQFALTEGYAPPDGYDGFLPTCAFDGTCDDANDLIVLVIRAVDYLFKFLGVIAFLFFIIGGVTMILSFGSPEKFQKGRQILVAAIIGLVISLGAFSMVSFLLDTVGVTETFRVIE